MINKFTFDVIIATYNRPLSLKRLINDILNCNNLPEKIIVVDSSDLINEEIKNYKLVEYIKSNHKNQPYQRYLGYQLSSSEILYYFDDDMQILDQNLFNDTLGLLKDDEVVASTFNNTYNHVFFENESKSFIQNIFSKFKNTFNIIKYLTGNPKLDAGEYWLCGTKGTQPLKVDKTYWFWGTGFCVKRDKIYKNFNFKLFDLYENKLGKGEDGILGYTVSKQGKILYYSKNSLNHEDQQNSVYSTDYKTYGRRVSYSRLYLSLEYCRLNNTNYKLAYLHYNWYMLWRILGLKINNLFSYEEKRHNLLIGYLEGWEKARKNGFRNFFKNEFDWSNEVKNNMMRTNEL